MMRLPRFGYVAPGSLAEAAAAIADLGPEATVLAGGTDLLPNMKRRQQTPAAVVALRGIAALRGRSFGADRGLTLGALTPLSAIEHDPAIAEAFPALARAASLVATPPIRNMATLGGNLAQRPRCWYFRSIDFHCKKKGGEVCFAQAGENQFHSIMGNHICAATHASTMATALVAYDARVRLSGPGGDREIALEQFFTTPEVDVKRENSLLPGELIAEVRLPAPAAGTRASYWKQGERESYDWPIADVAVVLEMSGTTCKRASIVLGAAAPVPVRAKAAEAQLKGKTIDASLATAAARAALAGATPMTKNRYKLEIFETVIQRTILAANGGAA